MSTYIHFTEEQKQKARQTDLVSFLQLQGETIKHSGSEYQWKDGYRKVTIRGNLWYHQYEQVGGDAVDFVRRFYDMSYPEAVQFLLGSGSVVLATPIERERAEFVLPTPNRTRRQAYNYLTKTRGIDESIVNTFVREKMIYESAKHHNVVFVGYDKDGISRHAHKRGVFGKYRGNAAGSLPEYSFHWNGNSEKLYLFEAPIDMLSFLSLHNDHWQEHSYAAACGVSSLVMHQMIKENPNIRKVYLCHDNDEGGEKAVQRISAELKEKGIAYERLIPTFKDWNEDLVHIKEEESECQPSMGIHCC